ERDVLHVLDAHHASKLVRRLPAPEAHAVTDFGGQRFAGHVRLVPAVGGSHAAIGNRGVVDDRVDGVEVRIGAGADHGTVKGERKISTFPSRVTPSCHAAFVPSGSGKIRQVVVPWA